MTNAAKLFSLLSYQIALSQDSTEDPLQVEARGGPEGGEGSFHGAHLRVDHFLIRDARPSRKCEQAHPRPSGAYSWQSYEPWRYRAVPTASHPNHCLTKGRETQRCAKLARTGIFHSGEGTEVVLELTAMLAASAAKVLSHEVMPALKEWLRMSPS